MKENTVMIIAIIHYNSVRYRRNGYMIIICVHVCVWWCMCECGCVCNVLYGSLTRLSWLVCGLIKAQRPS